MDDDERKYNIEKSTADYNKIFEKFMESLIKKCEEPQNEENNKLYSFLNFNIKYLEKYIYIMKNIKSKDELTIQIENLNCINAIIGALYTSTTDSQNISSSKVEILS